MNNNCEEKIEDIEYFDKERNFVIEIYNKAPVDNNNWINLDDVINETVISKFS